MGRMQNATKGGYHMVDEPSREVGSSGGNNEANYKVCSSWPFQKTECNGSLKMCFIL